MEKNPFLIPVEQFDGAGVSESKRDIASDDDFFVPLQPKQEAVEEDDFFVSLNPKEEQLEEDDFFVPISERSIESLRYSDPVRIGAEEFVPADPIKEKKLSNFEELQEMVSEEAFAKGNELQMGLGSYAGGAAMLGALQAPAQALAGGAARLIAPELIERVEIRNKLEGKNPTGFTYNEIFPDILMGDVTKKYTDPVYDKASNSAINYIKDAQKSLETVMEKNPSLKNDLGMNVLNSIIQKGDDVVKVSSEVAKFVTNFAVSVFSDPLNYATFSKKFLKLFEKASDIPDVFKPALTRNGEFVITPKIPGSDVPMAGINAPWPLNKLIKPKVLWTTNELDSQLLKNNIDLSFAAPVTHGSVLFNTSYQLADDSFKAFKYKNILGKNELQDLITDFEYILPLEGNKAKLLNTMAEFPKTWKSKANFKYDSRDVLAAQKVLNDYSAWEAKNVARIRAAGGDVQDFVPMSGERFSESRGFGRMFTEKAKKAADEFKENYEKTRKMGTNPVKIQSEASKTREKLATDEYAKVLSENLGIKADEVFEMNPYKVMAERGLDLERTANTLEYMQTIIPQGKTVEQWRDVVSAARDKAAKGLIDNYDDLYFSRIPVKSKGVNVDVKDFKDGALVPLDDGIIQFYASKIQGADKQYLESLRFPAPVAVQIKNLLGGVEPLGAKFGKVAAVNNYVAKMLLSNPSRLPREVFENGARYFSTGASPKHVFKAMDDMLSSTPDEVTKFVKSLETIYKPSSNKVNVKEISNPENYKMMSYAVDNLKAFAKGSVKVANIASTENPILVGMRELPNAAVGVFKSAYIRELMEKGIGLGDAAKYADNVFLDMSNDSNAMRKLKVLNPFANYVIQNAKSMVEIFALKPGSMNVLNPQDGILKRSIESNLFPEVSYYVADALKFPTDPLGTTFLTGNEEIIANSGAFTGLLQSMAKKAAEVAGVDPEDLDSRIAVYNLPNHISANLNMINPKDGGPTSLFGPIPQAMVLGILSWDPFLEKDVQFKGTDVGRERAIIEGLNKLNPFQFKSFMNMVVRPYINEKYPDWRDRFVNLGAGETSLKLAERVLGTKLSLSEDVMQSVFNAMTGGTGYISREGLTYYFNQVALMKQFAKYRKEARLLVGRQDQQAAVMELKRAVGEVKQKITRNRVVFESIQRLREEGRLPAMPPIQWTEDEVEYDREEPVDNVIDNGEDPVFDDADREPQSLSAAGRPISGDQTAEGFAPDREGVEALLNIGNDIASQITLPIYGQDNNWNPEYFKEFDRIGSELGLDSNLIRAISETMFPQGSIESLYRNDRMQMQSPMDGEPVVDEYERSLNRLPAAAPDKLSQFSPGPSGGGNIGASIGASAALGTQMIGSDASEEFRRLMKLPENQLLAEPDNILKKTIMELRGFDERKAERKGKSYNVLIKNPYSKEKPNDFYGKNVGPLDDSMPPNYTEILFQDPNLEVGDEHFEEKGVAGHVRGFAPNPDTFVVFELQKGQQSKDISPRLMFEEAVKFAKDNGYKNIGIMSPDGVARIEGHRRTSKGFEKVYGEELVNMAQGLLKNKAVDNKFEWSGEYSDPFQERAKKIREITESFSPEQKSLYDKLSQAKQKMNSARGSVESLLQDLVEEIGEDGVGEIARVIFKHKGMLDDSVTAQLIERLENYGAIDYLNKLLRESKNYYREKVPHLELLSKAREDQDFHKKYLELQDSYIPDPKKLSPSSKRNLNYKQFKLSPAK